MNKVDINLIADYTVLKLHKKDINIIPLQLQKLLYYIQAWHMVYFGRENTLFDEVPKAFMCGAIYPTIYKRYEQVNTYSFIPLPNINSLKELNLEEEQYKFLDSIYEHYGKMSHDRLVQLNFNSQPWYEQREGLKPFEASDRDISLDSMYSFYKKRLKHGA